MKYKYIFLALSFIFLCVIFVSQIDAQSPSTAAPSQRQNCFTTAACIKKHAHYWINPKGKHVLLTVGLK